jgi:DNA-binding IclR family transcriptional regulator
MKDKINSIEKAFRILDIFLDTGDDEIRLSELAKLSGLHLATVNRIASLLVKLGYLNQVDPRGKYLLGPKFLMFNSITEKKGKLSNIAMPHLIKISELTGETTAIFYWDGRNLVYVDEVQKKHPLNVDTKSRVNVPLYCTGGGKIVLADKTEQELEEYLENADMQAYTPNTITDHARLKSHLAQVARDDIAYDNEEYIVGVREVVAGFRDVTGRIAGYIGVTVPSARATEEYLGKIAPHLKQSAVDISKQLGYRVKIINSHFKGGANSRTNKNDLKSNYSNYSKARRFK